MQNMKYVTSHVSGTELKFVSWFFRIKRAFLIEEQKIVVKVLKAQAQSQKTK